MKLTFISMLMLLSLFSCKGFEDDSWKMMIMPVLLTVCNGPDVFSTVFTDLQDGTIKREERYDFYGGCNNETHEIRSVVYIKKCLQGQVYRSAQNDCQGTGTSPDWGAVKYQFCPTNDRACDMIVQDEDGYDIYVADPTKSPAAMSCAGDTTARKSWRMPAIFGDLNFPVDIRPYFPEIPYGSSNLIWKNKPYFTTTSVTYSFDTSGIIVSGNYVDKNLSHYVQCFSN